MGLGIPPFRESKPLRLRIIFTGAPFTIPINDDHFTIPTGSAGFVIIPAGTTHEIAMSLPPRIEVTVMVATHNPAGFSTWSEHSTIYTV